MPEVAAASCALAGTACQSANRTVIAEDPYTKLCPSNCCKTGRIRTESWMMEPFKIEIARAERPTDPLQYVTLTASESESVFARVSGLEKLRHYPPALFFSALVESLTCEHKCEGKLQDCLSDWIGVDGSSDDQICYLLWEVGEAVDQFRVDDLLRDWEYIWYPTSDEVLVIYIPKVERIILLTDYGMIKTNF